MCGIYGYRINEKTKGVSKLNDRLQYTIQHRGPDGEGLYKGSEYVLGHTRLSILDLEYGDQPMHNKSHHLIFNGEIYNHAELRDFLVSNGYSFKTTSDTEVVLKLFDHLGYKFIDRLNGIFSIVIYDEQKEELIICRDYFGVKPFYYFSKDDHFAFASEFKVLIAYLNVLNVSYAPEIDALKEYLIKGYINQYSLVDGVQTLEPGVVFSYTKKNGLTKKFKIKPGETQASSSDDFLLEFSKQVNMELLADVDVGIMLSGGVDSSLITSLSSAKSDRIKTFSIGFHESSTYDESEFAREVSQKCKTEHYEFKFNEKDLLDQVEPLVSAMDLPIYDPAMLPLLYLSKKTKEHVKAALAGDGGDEFFGGYRHYQIEKFKFFFKLVNTCLKPFRPFVPKLKVLDNLIKSNGRHKGPFSKTPEYVHDCPYFNSVPAKGFRNLMKFDVDNDLKDRLLIKTDICSMHYGLEVRVPFISRKIFAISRGMKTKDLITWRFGKIVLRRLLQRRLGDHIAYKNKKGFRVPIKEWVSKGNLGSIISHELKSNNLIPEDVMDSKHIKSLLMERKSGNVSDQLFALYLLNRWLGKLNKIQ